MSASSNWLALQKKIGLADGHRKRRKLSHDSSTPGPSTLAESTSTSTTPSFTRTSVHRPDELLPSDATVVNGEAIGPLRKMIHSSHDLQTFSEKDRLPGTYIAIDCEMVGVGPNGSESSLARVSVINYAGAVLLDAFVRQRERVTDWRTQWSGIRPNDMSNARPFEEVQKTVADLLDGRVLVGHAVHNDLQALMLSHPRAQTRDTQLLAYRHGQTKTRRPALRNLVRDMLGVAIQEGEHSSVVDARATMAVYRLHRKQWDRAFNVQAVRVKLQADGPNTSSPSSNSQSHGKRKQNPEDDDTDQIDGDGLQQISRLNRAKPANAVKIAKSGAVLRKGTSSGLSVVIRGHGKKHASTKGSGSSNDEGSKVKWWKKLAITDGPSSGKRGAKLSMRS